MRRALLALPLLALAACGGSAPLYAIDAAPAEVDGDAGEWPAALRPVPDESGLSLGLRQDGGDLLVAVIAGDDRQARRIALGGLALWIDPAGGTDRVLGVRYPTPEAPDLEQVIRSGPRRGGPSAADPQRLRRRFEAGLGEVEVTTGVVTRRADPLGGVEGLEAAAMWGERGLVVEFRIPLAAAPGLLPTSAGDAVGVGVELLDASRAALSQTIRERRQQDVRGEDRPMPSADRSALPPDATDFATVTRWLRAELR